MHVPPGGGPPHHRHDFEESFTIAFLNKERMVLHQLPDIDIDFAHDRNDASGQGKKAAIKSIIS